MENKKGKEEHYVHFDISKARQNQMVKRMSHNSLMNQQFGMKKKNSYLGNPDAQNYQIDNDEQPKTTFKVHTNRGGHI